ncbi:MAG: hypothetical protein ACYDBJ_22560 [Aggregatilineales bacterium]
MAHRAWSVMTSAPVVAVELAEALVSGPGSPGPPALHAPGATCHAQPGQRQVLT